MRIFVVSSAREYRRLAEMADDPSAWIRRIVRSLKGRTVVMSVE